MTPSQWLEEHLHGHPGSDQRTAYRLVAELAPERGLYASIDKFSEIVEKLKARDSAYFYKIAKGLDALTRNEQILSENPRYHLVCAYEMLCARNSGTPPLKKELNEAAQHHWAAKRVLNNTALPSTAKMEKLITREKERLPKVKWNRYYKELGLENLLAAKAGRRKSPRL